MANEIRRAVVGSVLAFFGLIGGTVVYQNGCGVRHSEVKHTFRYEGREAAVIKDDVILGRDRHYIVFDAEGLEEGVQYLQMKKPSIRQISGEVTDDDGHVISLNTLSVDGEPFD